MIYNLIVIVIYFLGLLETLTSIVITLPDNQVNNVFQKVLKPDIALVLAHHSSPQIRTAVIQVDKIFLHKLNVIFVEPCYVKITWDKKNIALNLRRLDLFRDSNFDLRADI